MMAQCGRNMLYYGKTDVQKVALKTVKLSVKSVWMQQDAEL
jgi:hypothetical protein